MNTLEGNKLIAEFMGYKQDANGKYEIIEDFDIVENIQTYVEDDDYRTVEGGIVLVNFLPEEMRFHISWDWLIPVYAQLKKHMSVIGIDIFDEYESNVHNIEDAIINNDVYAVFSEVVELINDVKG